jgi:hypothetical protein
MITPPPVPRRRSERLGRSPGEESRRPGWDESEPARPVGPQVDGSAIHPIARERVAGGPVRPASSGRRWGTGRRIRRSRHTSRRSRRSASHPTPEPRRGRRRCKTCTCCICQGQTKPPWFSPLPRGSTRRRGAPGIDEPPGIRGAPLLSRVPSIRPSAFSSGPGPHGPRPARRPPSQARDAWREDQDGLQASVVEAFVSSR